MTKRVMKLCLLICMSLGLGGMNGISMTRISDDRVSTPPPTQEGRLPIRAFIVSIMPGTRQQLFNQFREYAETNVLTLRIVPVRAGGEHFLVQMWREDIELIGTNSTELNEFQIGMYQLSEEPVSPAAIEDLVNSLNHAVHRVNGAEFSVTQ